VAARELYFNFCNGFSMGQEGERERECSRFLSEGRAGFGIGWIHHTYKQVYLLYSANESDG
jgi:hypothetical protein